jgi:ribosome biogenesis GTPase
MTLPKTGIILKAISGFYYVDTGSETIECKARGRFRHDSITPLVGDTAEITIGGDGKGILESVRTRRNVFVRPPIANVDQLIIMASGVIPVTDPFLIDRMTVIAAQNNCDCVICINKSDLDRGDILYDTYCRAGYTTLRTSAKTGEGIEALRAAIKDKVSAFTGNSGVGKSSILNVLEPGFNLTVGEVSQKLGRGRHTTRHVELYRLSDGAVVADTPGFSAFDTDMMTLSGKEELQHVFPEFRPFIGACRYNDCAHLKEPGCAVLEALGRGDIPPSRHQSYTLLYEQLKNRNDWEKPS